MTRIFFTALVALLLLFSCGSPKTGTQLTAQSVDIDAAKARFGNDYNQEELQQLARAEQMHLLADSTMAETEELLTQATELEQAAQSARSPNEQKRQLAKANKLREQAQQNHVAASAQHAQASQTSYKVFKATAQRMAAKEYPDYVRSAAEEAEEQARTHMNLAAKKRADAETETDPKRKSQLLSSATETEYIGLEEIQHAIDIYAGRITIEPPVIESPEAPQIEEPVESTASGMGRTVYKVQIAASRIELPIDKIHEIFKPKPGEIINNELEDGWYKYAVGTFTTYADAQAYRESINVPGSFIIAYQEDEKIVLPEIQQKIARGEMAPIVQSDIIYKVQIAATKIPAKPSQLTAMYHGKQILSINRVNGWYKYTVGNFDTKEKAEAFRQEIAVPDAFVVAVDRNNQEVPIN